MFYNVPISFSFYSRFYTDSLADWMLRFIDTALGERGRGRESEREMEREERERGKRRERHIRRERGKEREREIERECMVKR